MTKIENLKPVQNPILHLQDVTLRYNAETDILRQINLSLPQNSFHFLTGASGAGKTSLLKLIYMNIKPNHGIVNLLGKNTNTLSQQQKTKLRRHIGIVFQDYRLLPQLNAFDNVALPLRLQRQDNADISARVNELVSWVGLKDKIYQYPETLSGGECQRLAIARAVITKPDILLADEPTGNIDDAGALKLIYLFAEMHKAGTTVIFATHNYKLVQSYKYPVYHLSHGGAKYFADPALIDYKEAKLFT